MYSRSQPRVGAANRAMVAESGRRAASSACGMSMNSRRPATSSTIGSPVRTRPNGPPAAASGQTCNTTVPYAVPLIRPSQIRTMSRTPAFSSLAGSGVLATSGIPGYPFGPHPRSTSTELASTSRSGSSSRAAPLLADAGIAVLYGNLAPSGAVIKPAAASPELLQHRGRAVVFDTVEDMRARLDDPDLDVDASSVLVLRGCGPKGYPGMPEVANTPLPAKLLRAGVRDMVRICDGRMSGTAYGTVVLHVSPEAAAGGPLGLVRTGD